jgi:hypothetical protein
MLIEHLQQELQDGALDLAKCGKAVSDCCGQWCVLAIAHNKRVFAHQEEAFVLKVSLQATDMEG